LRDREIDIAVNLKGFTLDSRTGIFACRPVPLQVNYLGYPGTMGADYMDYILCDAQVVPEHHDKFYSERVLRLPDSYQPNDRQRRIAEQIFSRVELDLPDRGFVFCCFNNTYKITPAVFHIWMRLLSQVEGSVLWLLEDNVEASVNLRRAAEARGVPSQRIIFAPRLPLEKHLARQRCADLFLDTFPCNAHTTASDALWAGLPLLTCMGQSFVSRVAGSLLHAAELPELVTHDLGAYERLALELAHAPSRLGALRAKLSRTRDSCALFDTARLRRHIESAYEHIYERHQRGELPEGFAVRPA
jgi:predicted O-linked N-acetylglucosamine transferase (SPINDLY family)